MVPSKIKSGEVNNYKVSCPILGPKCPIAKATALRKEYFHAMFEMEQLNEEKAERLRMAKFVKEVADSVAKINDGDLTAKNAWKRIKHSSGDGGSSSYDDSFLKEDIDKIEKEIQSAKDYMEETCKSLVDHIKTEEFQDHLYTVHGTNTYLPHDAAVQLYDILDEANQIRYIDHYVAYITENLGATEVGLEFLEGLFDKENLSKQKSFSDVWGYIGKINAAKNNVPKLAKIEKLQPAFKFFYNLTPVITSKINKLISDGAVDTVLEAVDDPDLKRVFKVIDEKFGVKVSDWLLDRGEFFAKIGDRAVAKLNKGKSVKAAFKSSVDNFGVDEVTAKKSAQIKEIKVGWLNLGIDAIAFALSAIKLAKDFKSAKFKDWVDLLQNLSGTVSTALDLHKAYLEMNGSARAAQVGTAAKWCGVAAGILTAVLSAIAAYEGFKRRDGEVVTLNLLSAGVALGGVIALIVGATTATVVLAVIGLIIAAIMMLILDPPVLDYLEDTFWSDKSKPPIKIKDTIDEFYKRIYGELQFDYYPQSDYKYTSYFIVTSKAISESSKVYIKITNTSSKKSLTQVVIPTQRKIDGVGDIQKTGLGWYSNHYLKKIRISKIHELWSSIIGGVETKHTIEVGLNPAGGTREISKMPINKKFENVKFDFDQQPLLYEKSKMTYPRHLGGLSANLYGDHEAVRIGTYTYYLEYPSDGKLQVLVGTKYASGCTIDVESVKVDAFLWKDENMGGTIDYPISKELSKIPIFVKRPDDGRYKVAFNIKLKKNGKVLDSVVYGTTTTSVYVATKEYIRNRS